MESSLRTELIPYFQRPLVPLVLTYGMGVLTGSLVPLQPLFLVPILILLLVASGLALWAEHLRLATILVLFGFLAFGSFQFAQSVHPPGRFHLAKVPKGMLGQKVELEGVIVSPPESFSPGGGWRKEKRIRFLIQVDTINLEGSHYPTTGMARLSIIGPVQEYHYGYRIQGHFRLHRPRGYWNPGAFNYRRYALTKGFYLEGWGRDRGEIQILDRTGGFWILRGIFGLRETMISRMHDALPREEGGMLRAIVLGDRSDLSMGTREVFLNSGTYHILVISGLHLGFLAAGLFFLARCLRLARGGAILLTFLGVVFYTLLTGGSPPIMRAALMVILFLLSLILGRERDLFNTLALAAFLLLLWNPLYLFDAGFQLTFAATGAILITLQRVDFSHLSRLSRWVLASLVASAAAALGTAPLLALHFNRVSLTGIIANLVIVPLGGFLTAVGMAYSLLLLPFPEGIPFIGAGVSFLARGMIHVASAFAELPLASVRLYTPTVLMILASYALFGLIILPAVRHRKFAVVLTSMFLVGQIVWKLFPPARRGITATFLDVGQGDAIFLELPGPRTMLVDGGGSLDDRFDIGERVVIPYLWYRWVPRLDVVVVSHPQPDHLNGLRAVMKNIPVGEIWESGYASTFSTYRWLQSFVQKRGIPLRRINRGEMVPLGPHVNATALHPPRRFLNARHEQRSTVVNNNSLVVRVDHPEVRLLLTGDIEQKGEDSLLDAGVFLQADLLKVPHHGSRGSSSASFLRRVRPRWAVIQAGDRNPFGHPHAETLARYATQEIHVFRTDRDGAVAFTFEDGDVTIRTYREQLGVWGNLR